MTQSELDELIKTSRFQVMKFPFLRFGQQLYNNLYDVYPEIALKIKNTDIDPYFLSESDKTLKKLYDYLLSI